MLGEVGKKCGKILGFDRVWVFGDRFFLWFFGSFKYRFLGSIVIVVVGGRIVLYRYLGGERVYLGFFFEREEMVLF